MPIGEPRIADMDERCLNFGHHFPWSDLYWDEEASPTREEQMTMKCFRCGETLRESFQRMMRTLKDLLDSPGPQ